MNVLHLDSGRELRGGQWQVIRLLRGLRERGHQATLLARAGSPLFALARAESFPCERIEWRALRSLSRAADLVHAHDARSHSLAALASTRPFVVSRRVVFPVRRGLVSRLKYARPKFYLAVSQAVSTELRRAGIPDRKICIVPDGVPLLPVFWQFDGPVILPPVNDPLKDTGLALRAARAANVPVLTSPDFEASLEGAGMLLYLTASEGLGSAALLAMSAGVPVIASDTGGLRELIRHGETGLLIPNHIESITAAIRSLRDSRDLAGRLSAQARREVAERFSEDHMVLATIDLYRRVLDAA